MPWYYAGPDAKPVGPITLEELHARRLSGALSVETYVIEYVGQPGDPRSWRRYREVFPSSPIQPLALPPPVTPPVPPVQHHPLFPSAAPVPGTGSAPSPFVASPHYLPPQHRTNPWCSWGFGLSLASLILLLPSCGLTVLVALPALVACIIGLLKVKRDHLQSGRTLALSGLFLSGATLLLTLILLAVAIPAFLKGHGQITTTEQSTNDSE